MVLSLVWYKVLPAHFGGQKGIALFTRYLAEHMPVIMLCSRNNVADGPLNYTVLPELPVSKSQFISPLAWRKIHHQQRRSQADVLLLEHCYYGLTGSWLHWTTGIPVVVHSHNIEYLRFRQLQKWWWPLLYLLERFTHRRAQLNLFKTPEDCQFAVKRFKLDPAKCMVVPYGLEGMQVPDAHTRDKARSTLSQRHGFPAQQHIILFNGSLDYAPNAEAVVHIVQDIMPLLDDRWTVVVCGRLLDPEFAYIKDLRAHHFVYAGYVDDVHTYFQAADVFINPVTKGGGVKVKAMEALSFGVPVVSYISGATGINLDVTGDMLTTVPDHDAAALVDALQHIPTHREMPSGFLSYYHWRRITGELCKRIQQLVPE